MALPSHPARGSRPAVVLADWSALSPAASGGLVWLRSPMIAGETVYVVGFPLTYPLVVTEGAAQPDLYSGLLVVTAPAMHGNSGGAVLACRDGEYRVAGIVTANALISSATQLLTLYGPQPAVIQTTVHYLVFAIPAAQIEPRVAGALVHRQLGGSAT